MRRIFAAVSVPKPTLAQNAGDPMRYILAGLVFAVLICVNASAQAERRVFIIANNADGYGVDRCLATGARCGVAVATGAHLPGE